MIKSIDFKLVNNLDKRAKIELNGKNLIITGGNGCGKTRFLGQLNTHLKELFNRNIQTIDVIEKQLQQNL